MSLLNDARLSQGLPPLGFLNPLIYSRGLSGFNDITVGNAPGCGTPGFNVSIIVYTVVFDAEKHLHRPRKAGIQVRDFIYMSFARD